jgi:hypothetical protein
MIKENDCFIRVLMMIGIVKNIEWWMGINFDWDTNEV